MGKYSKLARENYRKSSFFSSTTGSGNSVCSTGERVENEAIESDYRRCPEKIRFVFFFHDGFPLWLILHQDTHRDEVRFVAPFSSIHGFQASIYFMGLYLRKDKIELTEENSSHAIYSVSILYLIEKIEIKVAK
jgi:hypothetical protein